MGRHIPGHFKSPFSLAWRLLRTRDPHAIGAMLQAAGGVLLTPVDLLLGRREARLYREAAPPRLPQLFVCGPPRSGTSVIAQALIGHLPVAHLSNISGIFPHSPLTAERFLSAHLPPWRPAYGSYYGRVAPLRGPSDALGIWDRWLGPDRTRARTELTVEEGEAMRRFFGAWEAWTGKPLVAKNNNLNLQATAVAAALPTARFLCLERDPRFLAESLLVARRAIHGDEQVPYGLAPGPVAGESPVESVCRQVAFLKAGAEAQREALGPRRFWIMGYEEFCARPEEWIARVGRELLDLPAEAIRRPAADFRLTPRLHSALAAEDAAELDRGLRRAGLLA